MHSWWSLGEGIGQFGSELALYQIECPFCAEKGNFELVFHAEKKKPNSRKKLNFDVYKCGNCAGFVHVFWSASEHPGSQGLHSYKVLPWPLGKIEAPEHWPEAVKRYWKQAHDTIKGENWDAAAVMAGSALQAALRDYGAKGKNLKEEIECLAEKGVLPTIMKEWSSELRFLRNNSAHPKKNQTELNPQDVEDVIEFLDYFLRYLYDLPKQINEYRNRNSS